jgi:hypothetical protein
MQQKESAMRRQEAKQPVGQPDRGPIPAEVLADLEAVCRLAAQGGATARSRGHAAFPQENLCVRIGVPPSVSPSGATEPRHQLDQLERTVAWFDRFLRREGK